MVKAGTYPERDGCKKYKQSGIRLRRHHRLHVKEVTEGLRMHPRPQDNRVQGMMCAERHLCGYRSVIAVGSARFGIKLRNSIFEGERAKCEAVARTDLRRRKHWMLAAARPTEVRGQGAPGQKNAPKPASTSQAREKGAAARGK